MKYYEEIKKRVQELKPIEKEEGKKDRISITIDKELKEILDLYIEQRHFSDRGRSQVICDILETHFRGFLKNEDFNKNNNQEVKDNDIFKNQVNLTDYLTDKEEVGETTE